MGDIDPFLSPPLCSAFAQSLSRDLLRQLTCVDVSRRSLPWDLEAVDSGGRPILRISHTRSIWEDATKALAEITDVRQAMEQNLEQLGFRDLFVSVHADQLPKSSPGRRRYARTLIPYVVDAEALLRRHRCSVRVDVLQRAENNGDPRAQQLHEQLNSFEVGRLGIDGPPVVVVQDTRMARWMPTATEGVLARHCAKAKRQAISARDIGLLIEVEDAHLTPAVIVELQSALPEAAHAFKTFYVCTREHTLNYRVWRVY